jgi:Zn-dependent protease with chaperone function
MTFFEHQDAARRNTRVLVLLYLLALLGVVIAVDLVVAGIYVWGVQELGLARDAGLLASMRAVPAAVFLWGALGTLAVILAASLVHMAKLADGGEAVARMIGARAVAPGTRDPLERRLLNVVDEMAIASGVRVPKAYVMDAEQGINAFAAGRDPSSAVVALTRGALETLNRDELQGVIGHEFSHILNGDMRLNLRMLGVLGGIVFIGAVGSFIMRNVGARNRGSSRDSRSGGIFAIGLALFLIGYVGLFFARLIKAAVSRQREFLADASSVQFTRNPDGIAGALDQMRATARGTAVANRYAEDMSHMFFGQGITVWMSGLFDTHPPLDERIRRVNPRFQADHYRTRRPAAVEAPPPAMTPETTAGLAGARPAGRAEGKRAADVARPWGRSADQSVALVGTLDSGKLDFARRLLRVLPADLRGRLESAEGASGALVALMLAGTDEVMEQQLAAVRSAGKSALADAARSIAPAVRGLGPEFHLALVDLALPAAKSAPTEAKRGLLAALEAVIYADRRLSMHEFVVLSLVRSQLAPAARPVAPRYRSVAEVSVEALLVLSLVAHAGRRAGAQADEQVQAAFRAGAREMGLAGAAAGEAPGPDEATAALETLKGLGPLAKPVLMKGLFAAVSIDGSIRLMEAETMRLIGAVLDCPLPPLLEHIDPAMLAE